MMHRVIFKWRDAVNTLDLEEGKARVAVQVLEALGYEVEHVVEREYSYIERVYTMKEPTNNDNTKELKVKRHGK